MVSLLLPMWELGLSKEVRFSKRSHIDDMFLKFVDIARLQAKTVRPNETSILRYPSPRMPFENLWIVGWKYYVGLSSYSYHRIVAFLKIVEESYRNVLLDVSVEEDCVARYDRFALGRLYGDSLVCWRVSYYPEDSYPWKNLLLLPC